jgi:hypothetical protein
MVESIVVDMFEFIAVGINSNMSPRMYFTMPQLGNFLMTCSRFNMLR